MNVTINSIIMLGVAFAVSILNVTPEKQLQPSGQLLAQRGWHPPVVSAEAVSECKNKLVLDLG